MSKGETSWQHQLDATRRGSEYLHYILSDGVTVKEGHICPNINVHGGSRLIFHFNQFMM